jgi:hypothetical protein
MFDGGRYHMLSDPERRHVSPRATPDLSVDVAHPAPGIRLDGARVQFAVQLAREMDGVSLDKMRRRRWIKHGKSRLFAAACKESESDDNSSA